MTLKEFFRKARQGRKWQVTDTHIPRVRCENGDCPLAAVTGEWSIHDAAGLAGLRYATALKIATGADHPRSQHRPWLLKQLGIKARSGTP